MVEYALLLTLLSLIAMSSVQVVGVQTEQAFTTVGIAMAGGGDGDASGGGFGGGGAGGGSGSETGSGGGGAGGGDGCFPRPGSNCCGSGCH